MTRRHWHNWEKELIVSEAYSVQFHIKTTAKKYKISPSNIRRWKINLKKDTRLTAKDTPKSKIRKIMNNYTLHHGPRSSVDPYTTQLRPYVERLNNIGRQVSPRVVTRQLIRIDPSMTTIPRSSLVRRVGTWLHIHCLTPRRPTHVAQESGNDQKVMADFISYCNEHIRMRKLLPKQIVNMDETNVHFDMSKNTTWVQKGSKTVYCNTAGCSDRCSVVIAVAMDGTKLKPFIIFKGKFPPYLLVFQYTRSSNVPNHCFSQPYQTQL